MGLSVIAILLIVLVMASGCIGEKTVMKANITITEQNGTPVIESIDVTSAKVSKAEDYKETSAHFPGVYMNTIRNSKQIDYWRSVDYKGGGEYEIISELKSIPNKGDRVDIFIRVHDRNGDELTASTVTLQWEG
ncbi:MAG: hypothetical protein J7J06_01480 [Methanosarcinales archaeon]|nr:hypothetical protein [Methanosarcinales archaeon]